MKKRIHKPYNKFKLWLKDNKIVYRDLAKELGLSEAAVAFKLNGVSDFTITEIKKIVEIYNLSYDIFFEDNVA